MTKHATFLAKHITWVIGYANKSSAFRWIDELKFLFHFDHTLAIAYVIEMIILMLYAIANKRSK